MEHACGELAEVYPDDMERPTMTNETSRSGCWLLLPAYDNYYATQIVFCPFCGERLENETNSTKIQEV